MLEIDLNLEGKEKTQMEMVKSNLEADLDQKAKTGEHLRETKTAAEI